MKHFKSAFHFVSDWGNVEFSVLYANVLIAISFSPAILAIYSR